jgi:hypothetical protein
MAEEKVKIIIEADDKGALKIMNKLNGNLKTGEDNAKKQTKAIDKMRLGYIALAGVLTGVVARGFASTIKMASALEEETAKFGTVFRGVENEAEAMRDTLINAYGMSALEATRALSGFQDFLVPMGLARDTAADLSNEFIKLAVDMGSFNNVPTAQVVDDIKSALAGMSRPLRKYGVDVSETTLKQMAMAQGIELVNGKLDRQSRAQLILSKITADSADSVGDFARTQDSFANQSKIMQARLEDLSTSMGEAFLPMVTAMLKPLTSVITLFTKAPIPIRQTAIAVGVLGSALVVMVKVLGMSLKSAGLLTLGLATLAATIKAVKWAADAGKQSVSGFTEVADAKEYESAKEKLKAWKDQLKELREEHNITKGSVQDHVQVTLDSGAATDKLKLAYMRGKITLKQFNEEIVKVRENIVGEHEDLLLLENKIKNTETALRNYNNVQNQNNEIQKINNELKEQSLDISDQEKAKHEEQMARLDEFRIVELEKMKEDEEAKLLLQNEYNALRLSDEQKFFAKHLSIKEAKEIQHLQKIAKMRGQSAQLDKVLEIKKTAIMERENEKRMQLAQSYMTHASGIMGNLATLQQLGSRKAVMIGKAAAVTQAIINTAQGVTNALANVPAPLNIPAAAAVGVAGAVQIHKITSTSLPKAERGALIKGTSDGTPLIAGEKGKSEMIVPFENEEVMSKVNGGRTVNINIENLFGTDELPEQLLIAIDKGLYSMQQDSDSVFAEAIEDKAQ